MNYKKMSNEDLLAEYVSAEHKLTHMANTPNNEYIYKQSTYERVEKKIKETKEELLRRLNTKGTN